MNSDNQDMELLIERLSKRIQELEILNQELRKDCDPDAGLDFPWAVNLGHWYWNLESQSIVFHPVRNEVLGYSLLPIPEKQDFYDVMKMVHPDDAESAIVSMQDHLAGKKKFYEAKYRIITAAGNYRWFYDRGSVTRFDDQQNPIFVSGVVFDITTKRELELQLEKKNHLLAALSVTDGLTGLANHRALIEYLTGAIRESQHKKNQLSIVMLDIDFFKNVNDTRGHVFGDKVLVEIGKIIRKNIRQTDYAGRYGGEEFLIILSDTGRDEGMQIAERIRKTIENYDFSQGCNITISGGVSEFSGEKITEFIHKADDNLYYAKRNGRNQVHG